MNSIHKVSLSLTLFITGLIAGCRTEMDRYARAFDSDFYWGSKSMLAGPMSAADMCERANDTNYVREGRCLAVGGMFAKYIKPGFTSAEIHKVMPTTRWLDACDIRPSGGVGGFVPVNVANGQSRFLIVLFPESGGSDWAIYLTLPNPRAELTTEDVRAFLEGSNSDKKLKLIEYAICYRHSCSIIERFTKRGVGIVVM